MVSLENQNSKMEYLYKINEPCDPNGAAASRVYVENGPFRTEPIRRRLINVCRSEIVSWRFYEDNQKICIYKPFLPRNKYSSNSK